MASIYFWGSLADEKSKNVDINKYFEIVDYLENIQALENKSKSYSPRLFIKDYKSKVDPQ